MAIYYEDISGTSTSQVATSLLSNQILSGDLFLISQQAISSTSPDRRYWWHGQLLRNHFASRSLSYNSLSNDLFDTLCSEFGFGTMAWESSADYSLYDHVHGYSKVSVESFFQRPTEEDKLSTVSAIVTVRIGDKSTPLYMPEVKIYKQPKPYLGQLKFIAKTQLLEIDCDATDFDGWVYPDGREVSREKFAEAYEFFGDNYGEASNDLMFKLPCLTNLIKIVQPTATNKTQDLSQQVQKVDVLKDHQHEVVDLGMSGTIASSNKFMSVNNTDPGHACHGSRDEGNDQQWKYDLWFKAKNVEIRGGQTTKSAGNTKSTHPSYNHLPVLMYIGGEGVK